MKDGLENPEMVSRKSKLLEAVAARKEEGEPRLLGNGNWADAADIRYRPELVQTR